MSFGNWFNREKEEIPEKFHSYESGKAFENCMICDKYLLDPGTRYMIEKAFKQYSGFQSKDVLFEFAICEDCGTSMRADLSKESLDNIQQYFFTNANRVIDMDEYEKNSSVSDLFTQKCIIKNINKEDLTEFQMIAYCDGPNLSLSEPPLLISELAADEIQELISEQTRDELERFTDDLTGLPPELKELFKDEMILI
ncbi:MAG: hypothetical protein HKN92_09680 [Chitinophagales bacterium]|nr:hypothetical protein [Chitinophagales bacterium]